MNSVALIVVPVIIPAVMLPVDDIVAPYPIAALGFPTVKSLSVSNLPASVPSTWNEIELLSALLFGSDRMIAAPAALEFNVANLPDA